MSALITFIKKAYPDLTVCVVGAIKNAAQAEEIIASGKAEGDTIYLTILDDVLATGGTAEGLARSLENESIAVDGKEYKVKVKEFVFIVEIEDLGGAKRLESIAPVRSITKI